MNQKPLCLAVADLHLSDVAPIARSAEPDWFAAMKRSLDCLKEHQKRMFSEYDCSVDIVYAGDIFDHWNPSVKLVNFAIDNLPFGYAIAGQHDLPFHDIDRIESTGLYTLMKAEVLELLTPERMRWQKGVDIYGYSWNQNPIVPENPDKINIAVVHKYLWTNKNEQTRFAGAEHSSAIQHLPREYYHYNHVISGDNHTPFAETFSGVNFVNCGSLMARNEIQREYRPCAWLIFPQGQFIKYPIDTKDDKWIPKDSQKLNDEMKKDFDIEEIMKTFKGLSVSVADFEKVVRDTVNDSKVDQGVKKIILEALEDALKENSK